MTWNLKFCLLAKLQSTSLGVPCPSWRVYQTLQPNWMMRWSFFLEGWWWPDAQQETSSKNRKNTTSEFTNNEKHCHVFIYQSWVKKAFFNKSGMYWHMQTTVDATNDNNDSSCDNNENNSRCDIAISISHDNKQQLFVLEWWSRKARHQKLEKKMLDGLWVAGGFNYNWKLWAPTYNWFFLWCPLGIFR